jgi:hypothetical protein
MNWKGFERERSWDDTGIIQYFLGRTEEKHEDPHSG